MAYIGREPQVGNFQVCDAISVVNGQAAYTMQVSSVNVSPETENHMLVSLNGILQRPGSSFTVSGSTITFASNLVTGDVINFIHILGSVLDLGVPSDATVTNAKTNFVSTSSAAGLQIKGDGTTDGTLQLNCSQNSHGIKLKSPAHSAGASYTLTFPVNDGDANQFLQTNGSGVLSFAAAGGNTPGFQAYLSSAQTGVGDNSFTKAQCDTEVYDSDGKYDNSTNYRFTPGTAGYYHCFGAIYLDGAADGLANQVVSIYKNGSRAIDHTWDDDGDQIDRQSLYVVGTIYLDADDYIELYGQADAASGNVTFDGSARLETHFGAFKVA